MITRNWEQAEKLRLKVAFKSCRLNQKLHCLRRCHCCYDEDVDYENMLTRNWERAEKLHLKVALSFSE